jgi:hypothetical protein
VTKSSRPVEAAKGARTSPQPDSSSTPSTAPLGPPTPELRARFLGLVKKWKQDTAHFSSAARMAGHPAYQEIIAMGAAAVPLLLAELKRSPDFWFAALREITKENPVPPKSAGKVNEMAKAWLQWGQERGHIE